MIAGKKYTKEMLEPIVQGSQSFADVSRAVGNKPAGGGQRYIAEKIREFGIDTSHFTGKSWAKGKSFQNRRKDWRTILVDRTGKTNSRTTSEMLSRALIESGVEEKCSECGIGTRWNNKPLTLHVDHLSGNPFDNRRENLRFLCPNCHTQTDNYGPRNGIPKERKKCRNGECGKVLSRRNETGFCQHCYLRFANLWKGG